MKKTALDRALESVNAKITALMEARAALEAEKVVATVVKKRASRKKNPPLPLES